MNLHEQFEEDMQQAKLEGEIANNDFESQYKYDQKMKFHQKSNTNDALISKLREMEIAAEAMEKAAWIARDQNTAMTSNGAKIVNFFPQNFKGQFQQ